MTVGQSGNNRRQAGRWSAAYTSGPVSFSAFNEAPRSSSRRGSRYPVICGSCGRRTACGTFGSDATSTTSNEKARIPRSKIFCVKIHSRFDTETIKIGL